MNGELEFDKTVHPKEILKKLRHMAEEVGGIVSCVRICHGATILVYPSFVQEYYVLNIYLDDPNDPTSTLRVTSIDTWRRVDHLDLKEK